MPKPIGTSGVVVPVDLMHLTTHLPKKRRSARPAKRTTIAVRESAPPHARRAQGVRPGGQRALLLHVRLRLHGGRVDHGRLPALRDRAGLVAAAAADYARSRMAEQLPIARGPRPWRDPRSRDDWIALLAWAQLGAVLAFAALVGLLAWTFADFDSIACFDADDPGCPRRGRPGVLVRRAGGDRVGGRRRGRGTRRARGVAAPPRRGVAPGGADRARGPAAARARRRGADRHPVLAARGGRAGEGNRTPIFGLGSQRLSHWTTPAKGAEHTGGAKYPLT